MSRRSNVNEPWHSPMALMVHLSELEAPVMATEMVPVLDQPYRAVLFADCAPRSKRTACDVVVSWGANLVPQNSLTVYASAQDLSSDQQPVWEDITSRGRVGVHDRRPVLHFTTVPFWPHENRFRVMVMLELPNRGGYGIPGWWPRTRPGERLWKGSRPVEPPSASPMPAGAQPRAPSTAGGSAGPAKRHPAASPMATEASTGAFGGTSRAGTGTGSGGGTGAGGRVDERRGGGPMSGSASAGGGGGGGSGGGGRSGAPAPPMRRVASDGSMSARGESLVRTLLDSGPPGGVTAEVATQWLRGELAAIRREHPLPGPSDRKGPQELKDKPRWLERVSQGVIPRLTTLKRAATAGLPDAVVRESLSKLGVVLYKGLDGFVGQEQLHVTDMCTSVDPDIVAMRRSLNSRLNKIVTEAKRLAIGWGGKV